MGTCVLSQTQPDKQRFLRAVEILSHAVRAQANGTMDEYFPKAVLAKKIEVRGSRSAGVPGAVGGVSPGGLRAPLWLFQMLILEEASELLTSNVRQQAMLCVVALRSLPAAPASSPGLSGAQTFGVGGRETSGLRAAEPGDCHLIRQRPGAAGCPPAPRRCGEGSQEVADPPGEGAWVAAGGSRARLPEPRAGGRGGSCGRRPQSGSFSAQPGAPALQLVPETGPGERGRCPCVRPAARQAQRGREGQRQSLRPGGPSALAAGDPVRAGRRSRGRPSLPRRRTPPVSPGSGPCPPPVSCPPGSHFSGRMTLSVLRAEGPLTRPTGSVRCRARAPPGPPGSPF